MKTTKVSFFILSLVLLLVTGLSGWAGGATAQSNSGKTYVIGTDITFAPFEFQDINGDFVGIDIDLLDAIAKDQNFQYEIKPLGFNAAVQALESNQVDGVIAGMSITDERKQKFDFSESYFESGVVMGVGANNDTIQSYEDLEGHKVAVKTGTEGYSFAESISEQYGFTIVPFDDSSQMYDDVKTGNSVATFEDYPVLAYGVTQNNGLKIVTDKEEGGSYGFAVSKGQNQELLQKFNAGLTNLKASGEYDQILEKYLGDGEGVPAPTISRGELMLQSIPPLLKGLGQTLIYTIVSLFFAFILGLIFGLMKVGQNKVLRFIATVFVDLFRGIPLIVLAFFIYFGIPQAFGFTMPLYLAAILTLSLNAGAYVTEIIRGGIQSIDQGQMEAARSLGLPYRTSMMKIVIPQAIRVMIPSFINQLVITLKDTSILSAIGLVELTQSGKIIIARTFASFDIWLMVAIMYLIVITILTKIASSLEVKRSRG
ncbi:amino acid ABC transporter substrate-binding protein/permease [Paenibacillus urinalis]|uniref:Amino acid ABC transporter substrate-binding protein/permease n=1 Tax=Paenibacillus urinalis TaxID=521520 RepID=A0ABY7XG56_9BACL|nr:MULTISPECIES: amino acid ABC transporter substrate-binding protein/permease [Paenibacillus]WDH96350.1 amino acid ABC transporter substrate-binding protein/permease [Paenibacillus urinalis]WDI04573.1 amino acid ABC transporter substrate-binding protein/permease [Paenibacillus urinalis]GAK42805.1 amino acid ABC transporter amino acid-binding protein [Paenibacillus sp. TCA20]